MKTVKMMLTGLVLISGFSANAIITEKQDTQCTNPRGSSLGCTITITTSLPWLIIDGTQIDLNSSDAQVQLFNESQPGSELRLIPALADKWQVPTESLRAAIQKVGANGTVLTVENLQQELTK